MNCPGADCFIPPPPRTQGPPGDPGRVAYCGFDPTADALTIGNLLPLKMLAHWQRAGHRPIALMGGATGLIGDPSGKSTERVLLDRDRVEANIENYQATFERVLDFDCSGEHRATIVNNRDWSVPRLHPHAQGRGQALLGQHDDPEGIGLGPTHRARAGHLLHRVQLHDPPGLRLPHFNRTMNCTVQIGGSDQYGNIVAGIDLIRRLVGREDHASPDAEGRPTASPIPWSPGPTAARSARASRARSGWIPGRPPRTPSTSSGSTPRTRTS